MSARTKKRLVLRLMRSCGVFAFCRSVSAGMARILMYHNFCADSRIDSGAVDLSKLRDQLTYLQDHFRVVSLSRLVHDLTIGKPSDKFAVALTVDDGRRNFYQFLFPLLKEFAMPATFFVVSSFIRREDWLWTDKVLWLAEQRRAPSALYANNIDATFQNLNRMRPEMRDAQISSLALAMNTTIPSEAPVRYAPCTWEELREMADSGLVEIGSHTVSHPILASITDAESWREISLSRSQIEAGIGRPVGAFCFPNGKAGDYREIQFQQIRDAGYTCAVLAIPGMVSSGTNVYALPRIGVSGGCDALSFRKNLDGTEYYQAKLQTALGAINKEK